MMPRRTVVIAGGGTGGHIYPAIAIARALREKDPSIEVHFVGTPAGLETKIIPKEGLPLHLMKIGKLNTGGGLVGKMRTLLGIPKALVQSAALLMELKPEAVLGVGGYASGPFVLMAALLGFKATIWEPNAKPGLTNRWLSRFVRRSFVVFDEAVRELKSRQIVPVGLPVRAEVEKIGEKSMGAVEPDFHVLIFGGSQGARAINRILTEVLSLDPAWREGMRFILQTGAYDFAETSKACRNLTNVEVHEYLHDMDQRYQWADLVICRSGASTVAELAAARKPAILVPLPWAADDHQRKNAESLVSQEAAVMVPQKDLTTERLIREILALKNDSQRRARMREKLQRFHKPQAAHRIAELMLSPGEA
ncbi:MAG: undecaprenyldiphospho-muramoylpentapeptide beta-N-acetylglucosaminyltransferase [Bdellovibrionaceae bacterium]|nr:undecaprenyldiphospho-muramoylpentapeptide beta-N-acetylglucosaminyltransferase [Pseudobdellovibrionaceae bacterium]MBX3032552.1 undecaprenyldiphospho-muramoylpentapeptide beta-N-acetylglucosaminyltransferase [Pseudobdellovibrionaceae bacterium]